MKLFLAILSLLAAAPAAIAQQYISTPATVTRGVFAAIPQVCTLGDLYTATDKPAGQQLYAATRTGPCAWTLQSGGGPGPGGASSFAQLTTLLVTRTDSTHLAIGAGSCGFSATTTPAASTVATISGGTGTADLYCDSHGVLTLGHNLTVSCFGGAVCTAGVNSTPVEANPLATCTATSGTWDLNGCTDARTPFRREVLIAGSGVTITQTAASTTIAAAGGAAATSWLDVFDGSTTSLQDGTTCTWSTAGLTKTCTWTVPSGVNQVRIQAWSGGSGGGASDPVNARNGAGGFGGGYTDTTCAVTPGGTVSVIVGLGGAGAAGGGFGISTAGGATSFGSCFSLVGGTAAGSTAAGWAGYLSSAGNSWGWVSAGATGNGLVTSNTNCGLVGQVGSSSLRIDGGGCGAGLVSAAGSGLLGGAAVGGGGGGGSGGSGASATGGVGGTSGLGGAGGVGGNGGASTCTNGAVGSIPGGGGGSAGVAAATASCTGGAGARGEIRLSYAK